MVDFVLSILGAFFLRYRSHVAGNHLLGQGAIFPAFCLDGVTASCNRGGGGRKGIKVCMCAKRTCTAVVTKPAILRGKIAPSGFYAGELPKAIPLACVPAAARLRKLRFANKSIAKSRISGIF
jgi:hypothetical protein